LTVAAAGGHHVLIRGAEGSGALMLARRLVTILPELTPEQQREVATIRDAAGLGQDRDRPFRAPHPTVSAAGLAGGGSPMRPGEATLAHRGVLLFSPLDEFPRPTLEALRAPLDDHSITIVRGDRAYRFPSSFQLVATASPCPCGHGSTGPCVCASETLAQYRRRLSTPLLDRFAIIINLPSGRDLQGAAPGPSSAELRARVLAARERRSLRDAAAPAGAPSADATTRSLLSVLSAASQAAIEHAYTSGSLSARGRVQVLQVARTIADLAGDASVTVDAVHTALALRGHQPAPASALAC
jgi:magnesium chelatase family protein